ncbi:two component transcriptional regulator, LytTR family [Lentimicrobium saccharophilum]|uniref:Two component transcriptional regulator, LytTR family n=1 Tax=Lentimicrobium saccharophilum TaxID=1678841 RepID=A0A0S7BRY0_9BACT|nr:LytTR family DNA-binding domain-containing protein [Lentimicrobium saccharophilum]GAP43514.1 two component transcriptional regulator, LytTR family [Lentimicrobium saccharophilum]
MIRTVIIDDEARSRETIREMIRLYCSNAEVVAEAEDVRSGISVIRAQKPDLVILDIKMPDGSGFDLLRQIMPVDFRVIFVTAFEEYAIKAFKFNAVDYITKPVDPIELQVAIDRVSKIIETGNINNQLQKMMDGFGKPAPQDNKKIILKTADTIHVLEFDDILRCESDRNYTVFILENGERIMVSKSIKEYETVLEENNFCRIHQSHIINLAHLRKFKKDELICVLKDNSEIPVAYRKRDDLLKVLRNL